MSDRVRVAEVADVPVGEARVVDALGKTLALFNVDGVISAIDGLCPHQGGPLADGPIEGTLVTCPWHGWQFDVRTGKTLALFNVDGTFYALDNACPHRGGPLGEGELEGTVAVCPWHAWRWDVKTGANVNNPAVKMACFPVSLDGGSVYVELP